MPSLWVHCRISLQRTNGEYDYRDLHRWIDEPKKYLGVNHRMMRHTYNAADRDYIRMRFGERAVVEWLFHIAIDNLVTACKISNRL